VRAKIYGTPGRPRVSVFKSNRHFYAQLIDDVSGKTLTAISDLTISKANKKGRNKVNIAGELGELLGKKAKELNIGNVVFDKGSFKYHGRVSIFADGLRKSGINV